jgi:predicted adenine nucleotide alpha hydrolase (AANH) superfamily ATPase
LEWIEGLETSLLTRLIIGTTIGNTAALAPLMEDKTLELKQENRVQLQIRSATSEDITSIALLSQELGYSTSEQDVQERLRRFEQDAERGGTCQMCKLSLRLEVWGTIQTKSACAN